MTVPKLLSSIHDHVKIGIGAALGATKLSAWYWTLGFQPHESSNWKNLPSTGLPVQIPSLPRRHDNEEVVVSAGCVESPLGSLRDRKLAARSSDDVKSSAP